MDGKPDISIIGAGKVGTAIGVLAATADYRIAAVAGRVAGNVQAAVKMIGHGAAASSPAHAAKSGRLVLLTVPDQAIEPLCRELAGKHAFDADAVVVHCSGAMSSEILASAKKHCGCAIGSMHPLQTFPTVTAAVTRLPGTWFFLEGDDNAVKVLSELAAAIGGKAVRINPAGKALYHVAGVMVSNYFAALVDAALTLAQKAGIDSETALKALRPLIEATVANVTTMGPQKALTGPIARGDRATIVRHLEALAKCPAHLENFYRAAGLWTADLAERKGTASPATIKALRQLLGDFR